MITQNPTRNTLTGRLAARLERNSRRVIAAALVLTVLLTIPYFLLTPGAEASQDPTLWLKFDAPTSIDQYADSLGTPPNVVVDNERYQEEKAAALQQQQAQQALAAGEQVADTGKTLSVTEIEEAVEGKGGKPDQKRVTALDRVLQGVGAR